MGRRIATRKQVIRDVEDAIQRHAGQADRDALHSELLDRLDAPEFDDEIEFRPVADIIAEICRDLGIAALAGTRPWKRRTPADIAALQAQAAAPYAQAAADPADGATGLLCGTRFRGKPDALRPQRV